MKIWILSDHEKRGGTRGDHFKNWSFYMLISFSRIKYDGGRTATALANHRFEPFLRTLKMEIKILANLSNKLYAKLKIGKNTCDFWTLTKIDDRKTFV